jgi:hypothetical protein
MFRVDRVLRCELFSPETRRCWSIHLVGRSVEKKLMMSWTYILRFSVLFGVSLNRRVIYVGLDFYCHSIVLSSLGVCPSQDIVS